MKAKLICHFNDIKEQPGDIVDVTSVHENVVFCIVTKLSGQQVVFPFHDPEEVEIIPDEGLELSSRAMIVIMSVSAVVGLLLFVIGELIQLSSFIGFMLCMLGYIATFTALRSVVRN